MQAGRGLQPRPQSFLFPIRQDSKPDGVCNPVRKVFFFPSGRIAKWRTAGYKNVADGVANPVRQEAGYKNVAGRVMLRMGLPNPVRQVIKG